MNNKVLPEDTLMELWSEYVYQSDMDEKLYECTTLVYAMVDHYLTTGKVSDIIVKEMVQAVADSIQQIKSYDEE